MRLNLSFFGAAQNVTGSCYVVEAAGARFMLDCGMYQERHLKSRNWDPFPVAPASLDAVVLTHAHVDHCGLLPKLVREGFRGPIHCTPATADILKIVLLDSAKIQVEDAAYKQRRHEKEGRTGPHPVKPLYTVADAEACFPRLSAAPYEQPVDLGPDLRITFHDAGHILGSAMIAVDAGRNGDRRRLLFSGDVGRWDTPMLKDPTRFDQADYVVVESTYGSRTHKSPDTVQDALARVVGDTHRAGGNVVIPSFAIERAQELLFRLNELLKGGRIPRLKAFMDSPMAIRVTEVFRRHTDLFDAETAALIGRGEHPCDFPGLTLSRTVDESRAINEVREPCIIIAGSGMCTGGRIKHHLRNNLTRPESTLLFIGYQANGTLGRILLEGAPRVRIHGRQWPVRARVEKINGFSAHADRTELLHWLSALKHPPRHLFVTHGEPESAAAFAEHVRAEKRWSVSVPAYGENAVLD